MSLTIQPPPAVASDLSSTYQLTTFIAEVQEPSATPPPSNVSTAFPFPALPPFLPAFLVLNRLQCQHKSLFSHSRPPRRSTLSLSIYSMVQTPYAHSRGPICPFPF